MIGTVRGSREWMERRPVGRLRVGLRRALLAAATCAALLGCGSLSTDRVVTGTPRGARPGAPIQMVLENEPAPEGFVEIAIVRAIGMGNQANLESVLAGLSKEAEAVGATVVVRIRVDQGQGLSAIGVAGVLQ